VLATALLFYRPATQELSAVQRELQGARERIAELESEVDRLQALESENRALEEELEAAELRIQILSALVDVNAARLALADEEIARAQEHLAGTPETLKSLEGLVDSQQREEVTAMQNRLELALEEMERDQFAAQSDLRVLATNLEQLEDTFSANP
jgi:chromosome segregation ATPase